MSNNRTCSLCLEVCPLLISCFKTQVSTLADSILSDGRMARGFDVNEESQGQQKNGESAHDEATSTVHATIKIPETAIKVGVRNFTAQQHLYFLIFLTAYNYSLIFDIHTGLRSKKEAKSESKP